MIHSFNGAYASMYKTLAKHCFDKGATPRIKIEAIYGSESGNSYELAKEFLTELIDTFENMDVILKELYIKAKQNEHNIKNIQKDAKAYLSVYIKNTSIFLKVIKKDYFEEHDEMIKKKEIERKRNTMDEKGAYINRHKRRRKKESKKYQKTKEQQKKGTFISYNNYEIRTDRLLLIINLKSGNEFKLNVFCEDIRRYDLNILLFFISTYTDGSFPANAVELEKELTSTWNNFNEKNIFKNTFYTCVGLGNRSYGKKTFCKPIEKCVNFCSNKMEQLNETLKLCETEDNAEVIFNWKVDMVKIMFLAIYFYYSYYDFIKIHRIFNSFPWNRSLTLKCCFLLFSHSLNIHKNEKIKEISNGFASSEKDTNIQNQTKYIFVQESAKSVSTYYGEYNKERTELIDPYENYPFEEDSKESFFKSEVVQDIEETSNQSQIENSIDYMNISDKNNDMEMEASYEGDEIEDLLNTNKKKEMLTKNQREKLTKEGYKIVGSHSAVKLCRWTKSQLRGRGGCYKNSFYGINSYQCMEMTPSLACANKCVFCWRHHKNPVGTNWNWMMDDPKFIVKRSIEEHRKIIKELKGVYGIIKERYEAAFTIKHCALSLVGEPIMYPEINELIDELHSQHISTFIVTNAQFPEALKNLKQVTQLYLSIDASNEERLKNIDRPLFKDFWNRYIECIKILKKRKERTVFRFTLVKEYNMMFDELNAYSQLIELGFPDFIEIKAATFCGSSDGYQLTMKNIPWYDEVCQFSTGLINESSFMKTHYDIACQHKHTCSVLIAKQKFKINQKWHTWINYTKFHCLVKNKKEFESLEYCEETPEWALYGANEEGFNPMEKRVYIKGKNKKVVTF